jgi:hypothetical protein
MTKQRAALYALTVRQPWALACVLGRKKMENRGWRTPHRGPLLIHSANVGFLTAPFTREGKRGFYFPDGSRMPPYEDDYAFGAVIGCVELADVLPVEECVARLPKQRPWTAGPWCWVLKNARRFKEPVTCRGALGLWHPPQTPALLVQLKAVRS